MKKLIIFFYIIVISFSNIWAMDNPFLNKYDTEFEIPPFSKINNNHFMPAFLMGIDEHNKEIASIINNLDKPSFENVIIALEKSGTLLDRTGAVFFNLSGSTSDEEIQNIEKEISPILSEHYDSISLNPEIFQKIKYLWDNADDLSLSSEERKILEEKYKNFIRNGALLEGSEKERYSSINQEISKLSVKFSQNLLAETNNFEIILTKDDLDGLPDDIVILAKEEADKKYKETKDKAYKNKYIFTPHRSSMYPFLTYSKRRDLREKLYKGYINRGDNNNEFDNKEITAKISSLRVERANLLNFETHAHYVLDNTMAKTPEAVYELLDQLWQPALLRANKELEELQSLVNKEGGNFKIASWDWWYYSEKLREEKYDLNDEELKEFFTLNNTIDGIFKTANKLFGLSFEERFDIELYHEDARVWEVKDRDGSHLGIYIGDYYTRGSKRGGAWMSSFKDQSNFDGRERPIVVNVCNFPPPSNDKPSLLNLEHVTTLFHEFGHALHGLVTNTEYSSLSGTSVSRDFVEFPSQVLEHWAVEPELLKLYAKHYKTGEPISDELIFKMQNASKFNQGFANVEYLAASYLDMDWHSLRTNEIQNTVEFENNSLKKIGLIDEIVSRYRTTYFQHIYSSSYSAGYYSYIWAAVLDSDAFARFKNTGEIFNKDLADKYRKFILEKGGTEDPMELYRSFAGSNPEISALLSDRGLE